MHEKDSEQMTRRPSFDGRISLGNVLTLVGMVTAGAFMWAQATGEINTNRTRLDLLDRDMISAKERLRVVENLAGRQAATLDRILEALTEIKGRLVRIERQSSGE